MDPASNQPSRNDDARVELDRILESPQLANAPRLRRLLTYLVEQTVAGNSGQLKESMVGIEVFDRSSDFDPGNDSIVRVAVRKLRARLEDYYSHDGRSSALRISIPKGHYQVAFDRRTSVDASAPRRPAGRRTLAASAAALLLLLGWLAAGELMPARDHAGDPERPSLMLLAASAPGADPQFTRYAEIMTDEIRANLAHSDLQVTAPGSTASTSSYVLRVAVRAGPDGPRASLLLRDPEHVVWTMMLDNAFPTRDVMEFRRAPLVATLVERLIGMQHSRRSFESDGRNPKAIDAWFAGVKELAELELRMGGNGWTAVGHLEQAIALEPDWAEPYLQLLGAYAGRLDGTITGAEARRRSDEVARRAMELAPFTSFMLGFVDLHLKLDYAAAARGFDAAEPYLSPAILQEQRCHLSFARGHLGDALNQCRGAVASEPTPERLNLLGVLLLFMERYDDVISLSERTLREFGPSNRMAFALKSYAQILSGRHDAAERTVRAAIGLHGTEVPHLFVGPLAMLGRHDDANRLMESALTRASNGTSARIDNTSLFYGLYLLGRWDEALERLHRGIENREIFLFGALRMDPLLEPLRKDPRFEDAMAALSQVETQAAAKAAPPI